MLVYIVPFVSMIVTLVMVGRNINFADIPGFGRLCGLMLMIAVSFVLVLGVQKPASGRCFTAAWASSP